MYIHDLTNCSKQCPNSKKKNKNPTHPVWVFKCVEIILEVENFFRRSLIVSSIKSRRLADCLTANELKITNLRQNGV